MSDIPPFFHSLEHGGPFQTCLTCERNFQEIDTPFTITKVFKGPECVFEYAMCLACRQNQVDSFSVESRERIETFFDDNPFLKSRSETLAGSQNHQDWTQHCATCRTPLAELLDYSIACMGFCENMVYDPFPMMVCSDCEHEIQKHLSKSTRDQWDKFILDNFDGPPADARIPDRVPILV